MSRKVFSLVLALALVISLAPCVFAASDEAYQSAYTLYQNGLFKGTGTYADGTPDFDLDRTPTRHEAVTMLVRLLGKEDEALANTWTTPFTDVADWAAPYVGYAYANGLTNGTSATTFGGSASIDANQYLTFVLRALGYVSGVDFQWEAATQYAIGWLGLSQDLVDAPFTRGDVAVISCWALDSFPKDGNEKLGETLFGEFGYAPATIPTDDPLMKIYYTDRAPALDVVGRYDDGSEYAVHLTLAPLAPVTDMCIVSLSLNDFEASGSLYSVNDVLQEIGAVNPGQAVEVGISIPEFWSYIAVAYTDQDGNPHVFNLTESGYDGSIGASEYGIDYGWYERYIGEQTPNVQCPKCGYAFYTSGVGLDGFSCPQCDCNFIPCSNCGVSYPKEELVGYLCKNCREGATASFDRSNAVIVAESYSTNEASYRIPHVNDRMVDAQSINAQIDAELKPLISEELSSMLDGCSPGIFLIDYDVIWHDTFFTLITYSEAPSDNVSYSVYNVDLTVGRQIANAALLQEAGMNEDEFIRRAKQSAWDYFEAQISDIREAGGWISEEEIVWQRELMVQFSEKNFTPDMPVFFDENDQLTVITPIPAFAGASAYERFIVVK